MAKIQTGESNEKKGKCEFTCAFGTDALNTLRTFYNVCSF